VVADTIAAAGDWLGICLNCLQDTHTYRRGHIGPPVVISAKPARQRRQLLRGRGVVAHNAPRGRRGVCSSVRGRTLEGTRHRLLRLGRPWPAARGVFSRAGEPRPSAYMPVRAMPWWWMPRVDDGTLSSLSGGGRPGRGRRRPRQSSEHKRVNPRRRTRVSAKNPALGASSRGMQNIPGSYSDPELESGRSLGPLSVLARSQRWPEIRGVAHITPWYPRRSYDPGFRHPPRPLPCLFQAPLV